MLCEDTGLSEDKRNEKIRCMVCSQKSKKQIKPPPQYSKTREWRWKKTKKPSIN